MKTREKNLHGEKWVLSTIFLCVLFTAVGCGSSDSHATKQEEATFRDRDPSHLHGIPKGFKFPPGAGPNGGPPAAATTPPAGPKTQ
jgi:hypothetical protein